MSSDLDYEEQKLLRRKKKSSEAGNLLQLAEVCLKLGELYNDRGEHRKALNEFKLVGKAYSKQNMAMEVGRAYRMVGEMFMLLGEYEKALQYEANYLEIAQREGDQVEQQRALVTIGRTHLLQGQSCEEKAEDSLKEAEKVFQKSLKMSRHLKGIPRIEQMDMEARSFLNLGVTKEHQGQLNVAINYMQDAIKIAKNNELHELLHLCYMSCALMFLKQDDYSKALKILNEALEVASRLHNKTTKMCETLLIKSDVMIRMGDFQSARQSLKQAYRLKTPVVSDAESIERQLKIVVALCRIEDKLITTDDNDHATKKRLYEQMGDGSCKLENYSKGIDYYLKMLDCARRNGETDRELVPIYVSLYQTYKDNKQYTEALEYLWKEHDLIKNIPKEAFNTLLNIAEVYELQEESYFEIEDIYRRARQEAKKLKSLKSEKVALKRCIAVLKKHGMDLMVENLETEAAQAGIDLTSSDVESDSDTEQNETETSIEFHINTEEFGDDVDLAELSNSENEDQPKASDVQPEARATRKRGTSFKVRRNGKGETQLHQACINGNIVLVQKLLDQGHPVNVRDNAGWLPLHEACIHGHKEIVDILVERGAHINDKGGVKCDGITPLYDACSNGNLEVIELLLDRGANCTLQTDSGDTALNVLEQWFKASQTMLPSEIIASYKSVRGRIEECFNKAGIKLNEASSMPEAIEVEPSTSEGRASRRRTNQLSRPNSGTTERDVHSVSTSNKKPRNSPRVRHRDVLSDSSDLSSDSDDGKKVDNSVSLPLGSSRSASTGLNDYRDAMQVLRKGSTVRAQIVSPLKDPNPAPAKRPAYLHQDEVDDDWLEDDLGPNSKRQKFFSDTSYTKKSPIRSANRSFEKEDSPPISDDTITTTGIDYDSDDGCQMIMDRVSLEEGEPSAVDAHQILMNASEKSFSKKSSSHQSARRQSSFHEPAEYQASLLEVGISVSPRSPSPPADELEEQTSPTKDDEPVENKSPVKLLPPSVLRVVVEGEVIDVDYDEDRLTELNVEWLINEVAQQYGLKHGKRPLLKLLRPDGGLCVGSDPLTTLLGGDDTAINSYVIEYQKLPAEQFFNDYCNYHNLECPTEVMKALAVMESTKSFSLQHNFFEDSPEQWAVLFQALEDQECLRELSLNETELSNEDFKHLALKLSSLKNLEILNLSINCITYIGLQSLSYLAENSSNVLTRLTELDLSRNPLMDKSLLVLTDVCRELTQLRVLRLKSTSLTNLTFPAIPMDISRLLVFDVSENDLNQKSIDYLFSAWNTRILIELNVQSLGNLEDFTSLLILTLQTKDFDMLRMVDLSDCDLTDDVFSTIVFALKKSAEKLMRIDASFNSQLTRKSLILVFDSFSDRSLELVRFEQNALVLDDWKDDLLEVIGYDESKYYPGRVELMVPLRLTEEDRVDLRSSLESFWRTIWPERYVVEMDEWTVTLSQKEKLRLNIQ
ncbi:tonsoku-like protein [Wyeomyia smithii]|uniref:tonsoku-like protein n=1 Tax=Wyeomyia smithii TaxID=174621 RepID=UPI0024681C0F|nr:tonsoku-like protein [Wyeomyia smithii]